MDKKPLSPPQRAVLRSILERGSAPAEHCILIRTNNGRVISLTSEDGYIATYPDREAAIAAAEKHPLAQRSQYQIIALDEL